MTCADNIEQVKSWLKRKYIKNETGIGAVKIENESRILYYILPSKECYDLIYPSTILEIIDLDKRRDMIKNKYIELCKKHGDVELIHIFTDRNVHVVDCTNNKFGIIKNMI